MVAAIDEAALNWGVKVLRYEIKDLTPPEILQAMQRQITAEREARSSPHQAAPGQINIATGGAGIARSEGEKRRNQQRPGRGRGHHRGGRGAGRHLAVAAAIRNPVASRRCSSRSPSAQSMPTEGAADAKTTLIVLSNMTRLPH